MNQLFLYGVLLLIALYFVDKKIIFGVVFTLACVYFKDCINQNRNPVDPLDDIKERKHYDSHDRIPQTPRQSADDCYYEWVPTSCGTYVLSTSPPISAIKAADRWINEAHQHQEQKKWAQHQNWEKYRYEYPSLKKKAPRQSFRPSVKFEPRSPDYIPIFDTTEVVRPPSPPPAYTPRPVWNPLPPPTRPFTDAQIMALITFVSGFSETITKCLAQINMAKAMNKGDLFTTRCTELSTALHSILIQVRPFIPHCIQSDLTILRDHFKLPLDNLFKLYDFLLEQDQAVLPADVRLLSVRLKELFMLLGGNLDASQSESKKPEPAPVPEPETPAAPKRFAGMLGKHRVERDADDEDDDRTDRKKRQDTGVVRKKGSKRDTYGHL